MKLHFDSKQEYQIDAIASAVKLFEGQSLSKGEFELTANSNGLGFGDLGFGNQLNLSQADILNNLKSVQKENEIDISKIKKLIK